MTFQEAQQEIESSALATRLNVASGLKTFLRAIQAERAVCELRKMLVARVTQENILSRLIELSRQRIDRRYENPWDTALTIYLWLLSSIDQNLLSLAADIVAQAPQCWWAQKLSSQLSRERETKAKTYVLAHNVISQPPAASFLATPATALALFPLDTVSTTYSLGKTVRIHMPEFSQSLSQAESIVINSESPNQDYNYKNTGDQTLPKAA
jgi:hypothetical protein